MPEQLPPVLCSQKLDRAERTPQDHTAAQKFVVVPCLLTMPSHKCAGGLRANGLTPFPFLQVPACASPKHRLVQEIDNATLQPAVDGSQWHGDNV